MSRLIRQQRLEKLKCFLISPLGIRMVGRTEHTFDRLRGGDTRAAAAT
jgi:hypothetical protein